MFAYDIFIQWIFIWQFWNGFSLIYVIKIVVIILMRIKWSQNDGKLVSSRQCWTRPKSISNSKHWMIWWNESETLDTIPLTYFIFFIPFEFCLPIYYCSMWFFIAHTDSLNRWIAQDEKRTASQIQIRCELAREKARKRENCMRVKLLFFFISFWIVTDNSTNIVQA